MGAVYLDVLVKRLPQDPAGESIDFLIDTGATYSVAPGAVLDRLGIVPHRSIDFVLADGSRMTRQLGGAYFEYSGTGGVAPVAFGETGDSNLLGVTALEAMSLMVDPLTRDLRRLPAILGRHQVP